MHEKKINTFLECKNYYTQNPDHFIENFLGIKLSPYQKIMLKATNKLQVINPVNSVRKLERYLRALRLLASLEEDSKIVFYDGGEYKEMTRDEAVEFILRKLNYRF